MGLFDWFKKKAPDDAPTQGSELASATLENPLTKMCAPGTHLITHKEIVTDPTTEQVQAAVEMAVNAYDEYVLLERIEESGQKAYLYGVGFGTAYYLEYSPKNSQKGYAYVKEGVSLEEAIQLYTAFKISHQVTIDFQWQWQEVE